MLKKKLAMTTLAAAAALLMGAAQAATTTITNGTLTARINDAGTFAEFLSDPTGSPVGTPGLSYGGVEYVNQGSPYSWYRLQSSAGDQTAALGSNPLGATTYGAGSSASTSLAIGSLSFFQTAVLTASNVLSVTVNISNFSGREMTGVRWGVGFDPDQGISLGGGFDTDNLIVDQGANAAVTAMYGGFETGYHAVTLRNTTSASAYTIAAYIDSTCCAAVDPTAALLAAQLRGYNPYGDYSISLAYDLGTLAHGQSASFGYEYVFAVPEPESYAMFLAGLAMIGVMVRRRTSV